MIAVSFLGVRTREFDAMRRLYAEAYRPRVIHEAPGVVRFALAGGAGLHVYGETDSYQELFGDWLALGLLVDDRGTAVDRLSTQGVHWLTQPETAGRRVGRHNRAADGNVYEVMCSRA